MNTDNHTNDVKRPASRRGKSMSWNNDRRCELIDSEIDGTLTPDETRELERLQSRMLAYRCKMAPLPIVAATRLLRKLQRAKGK